MEKKKVVNKIKIKVGRFTVEVGNKDVMSQSQDDKKDDKRGEIFLGSIPILAYEIHVDFFLSMSLSAGYTLKTNKMLISLKGWVDVKTKIAVETVIKFTGEIKGKIIGAESTCGFNTSPISFSKSDSKITISS